MASNYSRKQDVVITVLGGCVTGVFSDIPSIRVVVLDWDNINDAPLESLSTNLDPSFPARLRQMSDETRLAYHCLIASSASAETQ
jgi:hypothetical protein